MLMDKFRDIRTIPLVMLHYVTGGGIFVITCVLLTLFYSDFTGHYFQPRLLAITHLCTLGWISTIIMGSLYQMAPVISERSLYSFRMGEFAFMLHTSGVLLLAISFWNFNTGFIMQSAAVLLVSGIFLFALNIFLTFKGSVIKKIEMDFIQASVIWLLFTAILGLLMVFNFSYLIFNHEHLYYLKVHAHIGMLGWFLCLIIGVASRLIPMFFVSGKLPLNYLNIAFYCLNGGLIGFVIDALFFNGIQRSFLYVSLIIAALFLFILFIREAYNSRLRKTLDIGMKYTIISVFLIMAPVVLWLVVKQNMLPEAINQRLSIAMVFTILIGFITMLIMGQTFKTLAFVAWLYHYQYLAGSKKVPLPKDMYSATMAGTQLYLFLAGFIISLGGIVVAMEELIALGGGLLTLCSIVYFFNLLKIVNHRPKFIE